MQPENANRSQTSPEPRSLPERMDFIIECHPTPDQSVSDAHQALSLPDMVALVHSLDAISRAQLGDRVQARS